MDGEPDAGSFDLELRLRPHARFASAVRVLCSAVAAEQGFDVGTLGDLRIAVEDGFMSMLAWMAPANGADTDGIVIVRIVVSPDRLDIEYATDKVLPPVDPPSPVHRTVGAANHVIAIHGPRITLARATDIASVDLRM